MELASRLDAFSAYLHRTLLLGRAGGLGSALDGVGGPQAMLVGIAIASSVSMILPISTPPNAIAHSTGFIEQKDMMKVGIIVGAMGIVLGYAMLIFIGF